MTCRCKAQFCYICGLKWRTCSCAEDDLVRVQGQADLRRRQHRSREAERDAQALRATALAEEEREAIAEVEEFIRLEAEREAQIAEEERRRAAEERRQREEARIVAVNLRYHHFNRELELLHDLQSVSLAERHESENSRLGSEFRDQLEALAVSHSTELNALLQASDRKLEASRARFTAEYESHTKTEENLEDTYLAEMSAYWAGKPEHNAKVWEARIAWRKNQGSHKTSWEAYRHEKLQAVTDEEFAKKGAKLARQKHDLETTRKKAGREADEWRRKKWAEEKWVIEVVRERIMMLQELEQEEYAEGGSIQLHSLVD